VGVHCPQQVHSFEVVDPGAPSASAERLVVPPVEIEHAIDVLEPYLWHDRLCSATNSFAAPFGSSTTNFPQTWQ
jgi:hypothetical protein